MKARADRDLAEATAADVIKQFGITTLPVDPIAIAKQKGIVVEAAPSTARGVSGLLLRRNGAFGILYATHIPSAGFQRFSVAHELGHYFVPGHIDAVLADGESHSSRAGFAEDSPYELEADHFAAALLMPRALFQQALANADYGLPGIEDLATKCGTSLVATAIRYAGMIRLPVAIVQSEDNRVDFCFMSKDLEDFRGLQWPKKGTSVPTATHTFDFNQSQERIIVAERWSEESTLEPWFGCYPNVSVVEDIVGLGSYGKTITVVWSETYADEVDRDSGKGSDDDWQPRFAYGR